MAAKMTTKRGGKKLRRSFRDKTYYDRYRAAYPGKLIRRRDKREKRRAVALANPKPRTETPSDKRRRYRRQPLREAYLKIRKTQ
jgi:hypothetical protein